MLANSTGAMKACHAPREQSSRVNGVKEYSSPGDI